MYNRYVPQPDGSFRKNTQPEPQKKPEQNPAGSGGKAGNPPQERSKPAAPKVPGSTFMDLLPKDLNSEDLVIMALLLLLSRDSGEGKNIPLIALAIYLFL